MTRLLVFLASPHRIWNLDPKYPRLIKEKFPQVDIVCAKDVDESLRELPEAEIL